MEVEVCQALYHIRSVKKHQVRIIQLQGFPAARILQSQGFSYEADHVHEKTCTLGILNRSHKTKDFDLG